MSAPKTSCRNLKAPGPCGRFCLLVSRMPQKRPETTSRLRQAPTEMEARKKSNGKGLMPAAISAKVIGWARTCLPPTKSSVIAPTSAGRPADSTATTMIIRRAKNTLQSPCDHTGIEKRNKRIPARTPMPPKNAGTQEIASLRRIGAEIGPPGSFTPASETA